MPPDDWQAFLNSARRIHASHAHGAGPLALGFRGRWLRRSNHAITGTDFCSIVRGKRAGEPATVTTDPQATPRELYGARRLREALGRSGAKTSGAVLVGVKSSRLFAGIAGLPDFATRAESFHLGRAGSRWVVVGSDPSGVLYGCLELARRIAASRGLPRNLNVTDGPAFPIRGTCLFWMK